MFPEASKRKFLELHGLVKPVGDIRMLPDAVSCCSGSSG